VKTAPIFPPLAASALFALTACAAIPALTDAGAQVEQITAQEASSCEPLRVIAFHRTVLSNGRNPSALEEIGQNGLRNAIGKAGGNAFVRADSHGDWFYGNVNYSAQAYKCP
jgi:hypothetical protein